MIETCTPSGSVRPRWIHHELLVVLEFDKYCLTDGCDLYVIWSRVTKVNTTLIASCLILEFDEINVVIENY